MRRKILLPALLLSAAVLMAGVAYVQNAQASAMRGGMQPTADQHDADRGVKMGLGLLIAPLTQRLAQKLNITHQEGLVVVRVVPDGPAAQAGVQEKDILTAVNGTAVKTMADLKNALQDIQAGAQVQLTVQRSGGSQTITVTVGAVPQPAKPDSHRGGFKGRLPGLPGIGGHPFGRGGGLEGVPPEERFSHMVGGQFTYIDKDGNQVTVSATFGAVVSASDASLTIKANGGNETTYQISDQTKIRGKISELKAGDKVVVITQNNYNQATAVLSMHFKFGEGAAKRGEAGAQAQKLREMMQSFLTELPLQLPLGIPQ